MTRNETLARALIAVSERPGQYRPPREIFATIARLWSVVLGMPVEPYQVALCMAQLKVARLMNSPSHEDSWVDLAGYAACGAEVAPDNAAKGGAP